MKCENCGAEGDPNDSGSSITYQADLCSRHNFVLHHYIHCNACGHDQEVNGTGAECPQCAAESEE